MNKNHQPTAKKKSHGIVNVIVRISLEVIDDNKNDAKKKRPGNVSERNVKNTKQFEKMLKFGFFWNEEREPVLEVESGWDYEYVGEI